MPNTSPPLLFDLVRRGYNRDQVNIRISQLASDRDKVLSRVTALEQRIQELLAETGYAQTHVTDTEPSYAVLGPRIEEILRLAEEEAEELGNAAREAADHEHEMAVMAVDRLRAIADAFVADLKAENDREYKQIVENAQMRAVDLRAEANRYATATRKETGAFFEDTRTRAARVAANFDIGLADRRDLAERDLASRQAKAEARIKEIESRAEQLRLETEKLRLDAERRASGAKQAAQHQANDILAEANSKADRIRSVLEREIATLASRRDSISAQLTNVRVMLATLTGGVAPPGLGVDDET